MKGSLAACIEARALVWQASEQHKEYDPWQLVDLPPDDLLTKDMSDIFAAYIKIYHHRIFRKYNEDGTSVKADVDRCFQLMERSKAELVIYDRGIYHLGDYEIKVMVPIYKEGIVVMRACTKGNDDYDQGRMINIPTSPGIIFIATRGGKTRLHISGDGCLVFLCHAFDVIKKDDITNLHGSIDRILMSKSQTLDDALQYLKPVARPK
ncbi:hypothetical protein N7G274_004610 [Stereocaulon virgatum]|uniref:Uncharacterized protein n=1 Tax=Stereocaulon virgatum TaxID=373712 RepID=A0ABR4ABH2_9LECA